MTQQRLVTPNGTVIPFHYLAALDRWKAMAHKDAMDGPCLPPVAWQALGFRLHTLAIRLVQAGFEASATTALGLAADAYKRAGNTAMASMVEGTCVRL